jgi:predicted acyltransferase (DUF342 family)
VVNYVILVLAFLSLVAICFIPALIELRWPKDPGPVDVDLDRDIEERYFAKAFREYLRNSMDKPLTELDLASEQFEWLHYVSAKRVRVSIHRGPEEVLVIDGDVSVPAGTRCEAVLFVKGNLTSGENCQFERELYVEGDCHIGVGSQLLCLTGKNVVLSNGCRVIGWVDAEEELKIGHGCEVFSRATGGKLVAIAGKSYLKSVAAPLIEISQVSDRSQAGQKESVANQGLTRQEITWLPEWDDILRQNFGKRSIEEIAFYLERLAGAEIPHNAIVKRVNYLGLIKKPLEALSTNQKPHYMRSLPVWLQAPGTLRVKGSVNIPDEERVLYDLIVEGDIVTGRKVRFENSVQSHGSTTLGSANYVGKSLVADGDVVLGNSTKVGCCVDAGGLILVHRGSQIGVLGRGGIASQGSICMAYGVKVYGKIYSEKKIQVISEIKSKKSV